MWDFYSSAFHRVLHQTLWPYQISFTPHKSTALRNVVLVANHPAVTRHCPMTHLHAGTSTVFIMSIVSVTVSSSLLPEKVSTVCDRAGFFAHTHTVWWEGRGAMKMSRRPSGTINESCSRHPLASAFPRAHALRVHHAHTHVYALGDMLSWGLQRAFSCWRQSHLCGEAAGQVEQTAAPIYFGFISNGTT